MWAWVADPLTSNEHQKGALKLSVSLSFKSNKAKLVITPEKVYTNRTTEGNWIKQIMICLFVLVIYVYGGYN